MENAVIGEEDTQCPANMAASDPSLFSVLWFSVNRSAGSRAGLGLLVPSPGFFPFVLEISKPAQRTNRRKAVG